MTALRRTAQHAFTLIELLVVIAIIAILTAILLPVFASVREGARQGTSISNLKDIQQKMEQFKLDNHRYPDVLFGYAYPGSTMKNGLSMVQAAHQADIAANVTSPATLAAHNPAVYFPGLYPAYIKDADEFKDPNNTMVDDNSPQAAQIVKPNLLGAAPAQYNTYTIAPCNQYSDNALRGDTASMCSTANAGDAVPTIHSFYTQDAYDASPTVQGTNQLNNPLAFIVRYQTAREQTGSTDADYNRQLRWQNPPSDTVITATTYHVQNADKVLVMFESGAVKKMTGADFAAADTPSAFWKVTP